MVEHSPTQQVPMSQAPRPAAREWWEKTDVAIDPWLVLAFIFPFLRLISFDVGGKLFAQDIVGIVMAGFLLVQSDTPHRLAQIRTLLILLALWLLGQVATDIYRDSAMVDYVRGWSRILLFGVQVLALWLFIARRPAYMAAFALGWGITAAVNVLQLEAPYDQEPWKFGLGTGLSVIVTVIFSGALPRTRFLMPFAVPVMTATALVLLYNNSRAGFGILLMAAAFCLVARILARGGFFQGYLPRRYFLVMLFGGLLITQLATAVYADLAESGALGESAKFKYELQASGDISILQGGRVESLVSTVAIADSPILGHGSWARDFYYVRLLIAKSKDAGLDIGGGLLSRRDDLIPSHSYFFGAWVEAGILGGIFWFYVVVVALFSAYRLLGNQHLFMPISIYLILTLIWHTAFSPFGAESRFGAAFQVVVVFWILTNAPRLTSYGQRVSPGSGA